MKLVLRLERSGNRSCSQLTHGVKFLLFARDLSLRILAALPRTTANNKAVLRFVRFGILLSAYTQRRMCDPGCSVSDCFVDVLQRFWVPDRKNCDVAPSPIVACYPFLSLELLSCKIFQAGACLVCFSMIF